MVEGEEICVACAAMAAGNCEACGAALCADHDSRECEDVMLCADATGCNARLVEQERLGAMATGTVVYDEGCGPVEQAV